MRSDAMHRRCCRLLFGLECKVRARWFAFSDSYFLCLLAVGFLPCRDRIASRRHILDGVGAVILRGCIRTFYNHEITVHPGMDIALYRYDFLGLPTLNDWGSAWRLRAI